MDSYYLCKVGRETLRQKNVRFIAAIKPDRFKRVTALLTPSVQNAGESADAFIGTGMKLQSCTGRGTPT